MKKRVIKKVGKRGFTLIELLVVIAIIGILSSIVLVALRGARDQAKDARIISSVSQMRSLAEVYYTGSSYNDLNAGCGGDGVIGSADCSDCTEGDIESLCEDIYEQNSSAALTIHTGSEYCIEADLNGGDSYCVDSSGYAGKSSSHSCDSGFSCN